MRVILLFFIAFFVATTAIFSPAGNAATFAECKRAAVISNWPQLIQELGKDEFDAVIRSCAATNKASPKPRIQYREAEITSISGLPTGGQKVSHRSGKLLTYNVRARGIPVDIKNRECVFHEGGEEAKYAYIHTFRNVCDTTLAVSGRWNQTRKGGPAPFRKPIAPGAAETVLCDRGFDCSGGKIEWRAETLK
jgi:hypothetical protein